MNRTATLVAACAASLAAWAGLRPTPSSAEPPITSSKGLSTVPLRTATVPPDVVERLKRIGLDPKDPSLHSRLKALASQASPAYVRNHTVKVGPATLQAPTKGRLAPSGAGAAKTSVEPLRRSLIPVTGSVVKGIKFLGGDFIFQSDTLSKSNFVVGYLIYTNDQVVPTTGPGTVSIALGCGDLNLTSSAHMTTGDDPSNPPEYRWKAGQPYDYAWPNSVYNHFPVGRTRKGQITITFPYLSASTPVTIEPTQYPAPLTIDVTIDHTPTVTGVGSVDPWGSTGLTASNALLKDANTARVGSGDWNANVQGDDLVGDGVQLGPGWTVTSVVIKSAVSAAAPLETVPENVWRGATVTLKPQGGTLRTGVRWHYSGIDTLDYTIEWTLAGPAGQRPILTMAKYNSCDQ